MQSLKEEEVIEEAGETQTKEDKVAEIVRSKVEKNLQEEEARVIKLHIDYYRLAVGHEKELWKCLQKMG